ESKSTARVAPCLRRETSRSGARDALAYLMPLSPSARAIQTLRETRCVALLRVGVWVALLRVWVWVALLRGCGWRCFVGVGGAASECLASEVCKASTPTGHISRPSEDTTHSHLLQARGKRPPHGQSVDMEQRPSVSTGVSLDRDWGVTSLSPGQQLETEHERQLIQPLLGYDWIAGLLDAESSLTERSEQFFSELRSFRQVNKDECVHSTSSGLPVVPVTLSSPVESEHAHASDSHQCTFCYQINSRLFAVPLGSQAACPICKMPKAKHPHDEQEPAFVRVSIPRSTLLPAYRYKARRRSFDPSDSLGLSSHCLSGWSNSTLKLSSQMSSLDLRSSVEVGLTKLIATSALCNNRPALSVSRVSGSQCSDQLLDMSRLARFRIAQLGPASACLQDRSYPVF
ncbi:hypothetical protein P4O66_006091, partial [Electrophorus voltai]